MGKKLIAFDLDDTLYSERSFVSSGYRAIASWLEHKYGFDFNEMMWTMTQAPVNPFDSLKEYICERSVPESFTPTEDIAWMIDKYRFHQPDITLRPGAENLLSTLKSKGYRLAIITDGRIKTQMNKIIALGLDEYISPECISISESIGAEKTQPLPFHRMMANNSDVTDFVYVGDNPMKDFCWPNRLGWLTVELLDDGNNTHSQEIALPGPDYAPKITIERLEDLTAKL